MNVRTPTAAAALCAVLVGCASGGRDCTLIGFASGVAIAMPNDGRALIEGWDLVEVCIDDACERPAGPVAGPGGFAVDDEPAEHSYRLTLMTPDGEQIERSGTVRTEEHWINGEGCDPRTANASLVIDEHGDVTVEHPLRGVSGD